MAKKAKKKMVARVLCNGCTSNVTEKTELKVDDCLGAHELMKDVDSKDCSYGCLGYGSCVQECPFEAISIVDGIAVVDREKCRGCTLCVKVCPRNIIEMIPYEQNIIVDCSNKDKGKDVREVCKVGCTSCQMCVRACPFWAMEFDDNLAHINYDKCTNCTICAQKCPTKAIGSEIEIRKNIVAEIDKDKCIGCTLCAQKCPVIAIEGYREEPHEVDRDICVGCSLCAKICPVSAIEMIDK